MAEFLTREDLSMRLDHTICFFGKKPYYLRVGRDEFNFHIMRGFELTAKAKEIAIDVRDAAFSMRSPTLGYINYYDQAHYLSRIPDRRNKQGLNVGTIVSSNENGIDRGYFTSEFMHDMLVDKYPAQSLCLKRLQAEHDLKSIAFNRNFCLRKLADNVIGMLYKERLVAIFDNESERFNLIQSRETSFIERIMARNGVEI